MRVEGVQQIAVASPSRSDGALGFAQKDYRHDVDGITTGYSSPMRRAAEMPVIDKIIHARGFGSARPDDVDDTLARGKVIVTAKDFRTTGPGTVLKHVLETTNAYIAMDCDGLDPAAMPGTSAPLPGSLHYEEVADPFFEIGRRRQIVGLNVAEYYLSLDLSQITALPFDYDLVLVRAAQT